MIVAGNAVLFFFFFVPSCRDAFACVFGCFFARACEYDMIPFLLKTRCVVRCFLFLFRFVSFVFVSFRARGFAWLCIWTRIVADAEMSNIASYLSVFFFFLFLLARCCAEHAPLFYGVYFVFRAYLYTSKYIIVLSTTVFSFAHETRFAVLLLLDGGFVCLHAHAKRPVTSSFVLFTLLCTRRPCIPIPYVLFVLRVYMYFEVLRNTFVGATENVFFFYAEKETVRIKVINK